MSDGTTAADEGSSGSAGGDETAPWQRPTAGPTDGPSPPLGATPQPADHGLAGLAPLTAGTSAGWYRTTSGDDLRYWDGSAWTSQTTTGAAPRATYGEKFRRRLPVAILVVATLNGLTALLRLGRPSLLAGLADSAGILPIIVVATVIGLVGGGAVWALVAAVFPGRRADPGAPRKPFLLRAWPWAVVAVLVAAPVVTYSFAHSPPVIVATISSSKDGCHAYLDTVETVAKENGTAARVKQTFRALHDAAVAHDPELAADLVPLTTTVTAEASSTATTSILTRCVTNGDLTQDEIQAWVARIKALVAQAGG